MSTSYSMPLARAMDATWWNSAMRSRLWARRTDPVTWYEMGNSASAASSRKRSAEYFWTFITLQDPEKVGTLPAACHVEPLVSSSRSRRIASVQPRRARWYRVLTPAMPPPITTTRARSPMWDLPLGPVRIGRPRGAAKGDGERGVGS